MRAQPLLDPWLYWSKDRSRLDDVIERHRWAGDSVSGCAGINTLLSSTSPVGQFQQCATVFLHSFIEIPTGWSICYQTELDGCKHTEIFHTAKWYYFGSKKASFQSKHPVTPRWNLNPRHDSESSCTDRMQVWDLDTPFEGFWSLQN